MNDNRFVIHTKSLFEILLFMLMILPFFKVTYLVNKYSFIDQFYNLLCIFSTLITLILTLKKKRISLIIVLIFFFFVILNISNVMSNGVLNNGVMISLYGFSLCLISDYCIRRNSFHFFKALKLVLSFLVIVNFVGILLFPNGLYLNSHTGFNQYGCLLGYKNSLIIYIIPALLSSFVVSFKKYNRLTKFDYFLTFLSFLSVILVNSSTSIITMFIITFYVLFYKRFHKLLKLNIKTYYFSSLLLNFSIVVFRIQDLFSYFIVGILKKNLTFTGRTYIWDYYLKIVWDKPWFGYGIQDSTYRANQIADAYAAIHCHNQLLETFYETGLVGLGIYLWVHILSFINLYKYRHTFISQAISVILFSYFIAMLTDVYGFNNFLFLFVIAYHIPNIIEQKGDGYEN